YFFHLKTKVQDSQTALQPLAEYKWLPPPNDLNNPFLTLNRIYFLSYVSILFAGNMQATFFLALIFPPPASSTKIFTRCHSTCTRLTANAWKSFVVQWIIRNIILLYMRFNIV